MLSSKYSPLDHAHAVPLVWNTYKHQYMGIKSAGDVSWARIFAISVNTYFITYTKLLHFNFGTNSQAVC